MNKYQEAIVNIFTATNCGEGIEHELRMLRQLADKETPKKPIADLNEDGEPYLPRGIKLCQVCKEAVHDQDNYCRNCAQKLDWSEEE